MPLPFFGHRWRDVWGSFVSVVGTKVLKKFVKKATSGEDQQPPKEKYLQRIVAMINRDGSEGYLATRCAELLLFCKYKHKSTTVRIKCNLVVHSLMQRSKIFCDALEKYNDFFKPCPLKREIACPRGLHFQFLTLKAKHYSQGLIRPAKFTNGPQPKRWISLTCNGKTPWVVLDAVEEQIDLIISLDKYICEQIAKEKKKAATRGNTEKTDLAYDSPAFVKYFHLTIDDESYPDFIDNPLMQDIFRLMAIEFYSLVVLYESLISKFAKEYFETTLETCQKFLARFHGYLKRIESMKQFRETLVKYTLLPASQVFEFGCSVNLLPLLETHLNKLTTGMTGNLNPSVSAEDSFDNDNKTLFFAPELIESYVESWPTPPITHRRLSDQQISENTSAAHSALDSEYEDNNNFSSIPLNEASDSASMNSINPFVTDWDQDYQFSPFLGNEPTDSQNKKVQELTNTSDAIQ